MALASAIASDSIIKVVVDSFPGIKAVFQAHGLKCSTCWISNRETVQAGARTHRIALDPLLADLNRFVRDGTTPENRTPASQHRTPKGPAERLDRRQIDHVIAVMSGKGGVGKSLVSALIATLLRRQGMSVGVLDADITGPSIPKMLGITGRSPIFKDRSIEPGVTKTGIKVMSMNLLLEREDIGVAWRGPIVSQSIKQFFGDVNWGSLDYLIVDLPPGTSDAPMTVLQTLPLDGVILVTTPQALASMVVSKAIKMVQRVSVPMLGIVENMAYFVVPGTSEPYELFGPSRSAELVGESGAPLLGRLPVDPEIARLCDAGHIESYGSPSLDEVERNLLNMLGITTRVVALAAT